MIAWKIILPVAMSLAGAGKCIDALAARRHKTKLHTAMVEWWIWLDSTPILDYLRIVANWIITHARTSWKAAPVRTVLFVGLINCLLVTLAAKLPVQPIVNDKDAFAIILPALLHSANFREDNLIEAIQLPHIGIYGVVLFFDFCGS